MICPECDGEGYQKFTDPTGALAILPCLGCMGSGIASCCDAAGSYVDPAFIERECDRCGVRYRGPAVYCSLKCALEDA